MSKTKEEIEKAHWRYTAGNMLSLIAKRYNIPQSKVTEALKNLREEWAKEENNVD